MSLLDRFTRSLFVALAVGMAWGIRGDFGHVVGAMFPGAALGLAFAYVSGQRSLFLWMPIIAALSALGIGLGGTMSYGILHGYAQSDTLLNYSYGFLTLFLQGSAWGTFGGALVGLVLERKPMQTGEWLGYLGSIFIGGWLTAFVVIFVLGFDINPPRSNSSIAFFGAALGQLLWLVFHRKTSGLRGAVLGYVGFGLGMSGGRLLGNIANVLQFQYDFQINHWNVMETACGFIGGFIFCFGTVNRAYPEPPEKESINLASIFGILYVLGLIPLWHRISRIRPAKLEEWANQLKGYKVDDPEQLSQTVLWLLDGVCALGFVGAAIWIVIHFKRWQSLAALPVLWLSATMLLFQDLHALYFWYPSREKYVNMHNVMWVMFAMMVVFALVRLRPRPVTEPVDLEAAPEPRFPWARWLAGAVVMLGLVIFAAGFVNGDKTMQSANTRWPRWVWTEGPFPREIVQPAAKP